MIANAHEKKDVPKNLEAEIKQVYAIMERSAKIEAYEKAEMYVNGHGKMYHCVHAKMYHYAVYFIHTNLL